MSPSYSRTALVAALRRELTLHAGATPLPDRELISTGVPALDGLLPGGGLRRGTLVEYLGEGAGSGAETLALVGAWAACRDGLALVILDRARQFYPPAAAACGIDLAQTLIVRPPNEQEALWALDQALRCPGVGAVWAPSGTLTDHDFRRLQLAAESGDTLGMLIRSARLRGRPTWADVQWLVRAQPALQRWRLHVELVRCRGGPGGGCRLLELDESLSTWHEASEPHATHSLPAFSQLAHPATVRRQA